MWDHPAGPTASALRDHWRWRPEWAVDRPRLMWYLTFENQPALWQRAEEAHAFLAGLPEVDPVPLPWLHLTLDDVGYVDEVDDAQVQQVVESARTAVSDWHAPPLQVGAALPMDDSLVLMASPELEIGHLRDRLREVRTSVLGPEPVTVEEPFVPHVTLAYSRDDTDVNPVLDSLKNVTSEALVVMVPELTLAAVTRRDRHYQWSARAGIPLAAEPAEASDLR